MTVSLWQDTASWPGELEHRTVTTDIAIVGGGIVGATLAHFLCQAGQDVVVLESGTVGNGASGRNAGHCLAGLRNVYHETIERFGHERARHLRRLMEDNRSMVRGFCEQLGVPYEARGSQYFGIDADDRAKIKQSAIALQRDGFDVQFTEFDSPQHGFHSKIEQAGDMELQPYLLVNRLLAASGARVEENCEVRQIEQLPNGGVRLHGRRVTVDCRQAILANSAWATMLHPYFRDKVSPGRGQILVTEPPANGERLLDRPTGTTEDRRYFYFRQLHDGRLLIGGNRNAFREEEVTFGDEVNLTLQQSTHAWVSGHFPQFAGLQVTHRWAGIMGYSPDALPLVGWLPDMPSVAFAVGFGGSGMSFGPLAARLTAQYVLDGTHPGAFHVDRLAG